MYQLLTDMENVQIRCRANEAAIATMQSTVTYRGINVDSQAVAKFMKLQLERMAGLIDNVLKEKEFPQDLKTVMNTFQTVPPFGNDRINGKYTDSIGTIPFIQLLDQLYHQYITIHHPEYNAEEAASPPAFDAAAVEPESDNFPRKIMKSVHSLNPAASRKTDTSKK